MERRRRKGIGTAEQQGGDAAGEGGNGHDPAPGALVRRGQPVNRHHREHGGEENGARAGQAGLEADEAFAAEDGVEFLQHLGRHGGGIAWSFHKLRQTLIGTPFPPA